MPSFPPSPKHQLLDHLYSGDLDADVAAMIADGKSWRMIAETVSHRAGIDVSHESIRKWYGAPVVTEAAS
jgi:hypothetical protein